MLRAHAEHIQVGWLYAWLQEVQSTKRYTTASNNTPVRPILVELTDIETRRQQAILTNQPFHQSANS